MSTSKVTDASFDSDVLKSADWIVSSGAANTEGLRDGLVTELMLPDAVGASKTLVWNGIAMRLDRDFGAMRVYKVVRGADASGAVSLKPSGGGAL